MFTAYTVEMAKLGSSALCSSPFFIKISFHEIYFHVNYAIILVSLLTKKCHVKVKIEVPRPRYSLYTYGNQLCGMSDVKVALNAHKAYQSQFFDYL